MKDFPVAIQTTWKNCGPTCIRIVADFYGVEINFNEINESLPPTKDGVTLLQLSDVLERLGFSTTGLRCDFTTLRNDVKLPCIVHWDNWHYVVVYRITGTEVLVSDPASGLKRYNIPDFIRMWAPANQQGVVLALQFPPITAGS